MSQPTFFDDEEFVPWKKSQRDRLLDLYFGCGKKSTPKALAEIVGRSVQDVKDLIAAFINNEADRVLNYQPKQRISRSGMRLTENELAVIKGNREAGVPPEHTARLLQRPIKDFFIDFKSREVHLKNKSLGTGVDLCLAYRYCYYVKGISIVSDYAYDELEKEEIEFGSGGNILAEQVGGDSEDSYPPHIRALAMYLIFKYCEVVKRTK